MTDKTPDAPRHAPRIVNKGELAQWFEVSPQAVDGWIRRGCPAVECGGTGKPWRFDLLDVARWYFKGEGTPGIDDPDLMTPRDRLDHFRAAREETKLALERNELCRRGETVQAFATAIQVLAEQLRAFPDMLERRVGLKPGQCQMAADAIDDALVATKAALQRALGED